MPVFIMNVNVNLTTQEKLLLITNINLPL